MKKLHRIVIYVVLIGLSLSLIATFTATLSESVGRRRRHHRPGRRAPAPLEMKTEEEIRSLLRIVESENNNRLGRIENTCRRYNLGLYRTTEGPKIDHPPVPQYSVFYIDKSNKFSFCPVYKAGSSTWLYNLCLLAGMTETEIEGSNRQLSDLAREKYPEMDPSEAEDALRHTLKIMTVRHPFERLLSAYRDKLENTNHGQEHGTLHFYRKFGRRIVAKYRPGGNGTKMWDLLEPSEYAWSPGVPKPSGVEPTFREFVRYLIDADLVRHADDHWIPYYLFCTPCLLHYDVIAKVETMDMDQLYAIRLLGLGDRLKPRWRHKTQFLSGNTLNNDVDYVSDTAKIYFGQLTVAEITSLYDKYRIDFDLFGYNYIGYLRYAKDSSVPAQNDDNDVGKVLR